MSLMEKLIAMETLLHDLSKVREDREAAMYAATTCVARMDGMPHGTGVSDPTGRAAAYLAQLGSDIERMEEKLARYREEVARKIGGIQVTQHRELLTMRYLDGIRVAEIARITHYDRSGMYKKIRALKERYFA